MPQEARMPDTLRVRFAQWRVVNPTALALLGLVLLCIGMAFVSGRFWTWDNLSNVARQVSINAIIAAGMTIVILTGGIDLSVGAVMALSMTFTAGAMLQ
jgi:ribose transport system permease protein